MNNKKRDDHSTTLDQVLELASMGLRVHPLLPKNKVPVVKQWQQKATTVERTIRVWAVTNKGCNWGVATGEESGVFVVDVDSKKGGLKAWKRLVQKNSLPKTVTCRTGSGGLHVYFKYSKGMDIRNSVSSIAAGIDVRGNGGQVVVPPSTHPNGVNYEWVSGLSPQDVSFARAPKWLLAAIMRAQQSPETGTVAIGEPIVQGTRNDEIYHQALYLARQGAVEELTSTAMLEWCRTVRERVDESEVRATVASAYKYVADEKSRKKVSDEVELSDSGNAQRLVGTSGSIIRYIPSLGWHTWDDRRWGRDPEDLVMLRLALEAVDTFKQEIVETLKSTTDRARASALMRMVNWAVSSHNIGRLTAAVSVAKAFPEVVRQVSDMDNDTTVFLLNTLNGTLDLRTGELLPHNPSQYITRLLPHNYNPKAKCPTWMQSLDLAFNGDRSMIAFFQRAIGYSLSAALSEQCFFICWGESGNNGKSTLLETVQRVLGPDYAAMTDARVISSRDKDNHVFSSLAALLNTRMVSINEIGDSAVLDEELIKQLTGGDTLQAKMLYREPFTYRPTFKIWMRANNKPIVRGTSESFWRRVKLIPFIHPIPPNKRRPRHEVDAELTAESEGILAWAVTGFMDWYKNGGLRDPQPVVAASQEYRESSDVVAQFMSECVETDPKASVTRQVLYSTFRAWYEDQGMRFPMSAVKFSRRVADRLNQHTRMYESREPSWRGIRVSERVAMMYMAR